ncbi:hypothetical protein G5A69_18480 [Ralstonia mannitolilytica]|nr:hypothetical protein G5A69_18480 [Ralstonia mannitolilytica]
MHEDDDAGQRVERGFAHTATGQRDVAGAGDDVRFERLNSCVLTVQVLRTVWEA